MLKCCFILEGLTRKSAHHMLLRLVFAMMGYTGLKNVGGRLEFRYTLCAMSMLLLCNIPLPSTLVTHFAVQLILFSFCHRVSRYAGIFLFGVIMNLHHGQGLAYVMLFFQYHKLLLLLFYNLTLFKSSDDHGDRPRPLPAIKELKNATDVTERKESSAWNYDVCVCSLSSVGL